MFSEITRYHEHWRLAIYSSELSENDAVNALKSVLEEDHRVICHEGFYLGDCRSSLSFVRAYFIHETEMKEALAEIALKHL